MKASFAEDQSDEGDLDFLERQATAAIRTVASFILTGQGLVDDDRESATWVLHRLTYLAVSSLDEVARREPSLIRPIAESSVVWPAFISRHGDFQKANLELMNRLALGEKQFLRFTFPKGKRGKRWSHRTPANRCALRIFKELFVRQCACRAIERERLDKKLQGIRKRNGFPEPTITFQTQKLTKQILALRPPAQETVEQWFAAGWNMLLEETRGQPEQNADLRKLGAYRKAKTIAKNLTPNLGGKTSESNIRDGIKERLKKAFEEVVSDRKLNSE